MKENGGGRNKASEALGTAEINIGDDILGFIVALFSKKISSVNRMLGGIRAR